MIKITSFFLAVFVTANAAVGQPLDCYRLKEGRFRINDTRAGGVIVAERKGGYQTESMEALKATVRFKITWTNDCSYKLTIDKVLRNENKVPFPADLNIMVRIIAILPNGYTQEATSSLTNGTYQSEVVKLD